MKEQGGLHSVVSTGAGTKAAHALRHLAARFVPDAVRPLVKMLEQVPYLARGASYGHGSLALPERSGSPDTDECDARGELEHYFERRSSGRGIHKWLHFLRIYERHLASFRGTRLNMLEIGVQSGGSLDMWRHYFGDMCSVHGVDIDPRCKSLEDDGARIFIGDQADRQFWRRFKADTPLLDVVVDDGGHTPEQQIVSLEELLPHMRPGGVYMIEDVYGDPNQFATYIHGLALRLHETDWVPSDASDVSHAASPNSLQRFIRSIHSYPFIIVLELSVRPVGRFAAVMSGSEWIQADGTDSVPVPAGVGGEDGT